LLVPYAGHTNTRDLVLCERYIATTEPPYVSDWTLKIELCRMSLARLQVLGKSTSQQVHLTMLPTMLLSLDAAAPGTVRTL